MDKPKISIIVPVYKVEPYLRKCLDSIVNQTYHNLEIILIDDGSPDSCGEICDEYAEQDKRIQVIHKINGGVSSARNAGLTVATGEWIGWVDSDDWIEADMYEYMIRMALNDKADMVQCGIFFEDRGRTELQFILAELSVLHKKVQDIKVKELRLLSNSIYTKLYRAEILQGLTFDSSYPIGEDLLFHLHTLPRVRCIVIAPQAKYHYVQRDSSTCNAPPVPERFISYRRMLKEAEKTFNMYPAFCEFLQNERLRNDLDMCSKIVRYQLQWAAQWEREIRTEIKENMEYILANHQFTGKEKLKFTVITLCWPVYRVGLPIWKKLFVRRI